MHSHRGTAEFLTLDLKWLNVTNYLLVMLEPANNDEFWSADCFNCSADKLRVVLSQPMLVTKLVSTRVCTVAVGPSLVSSDSMSWVRSVSFSVTLNLTLSLTLNLSLVAQALSLTLTGNPILL